MYLQFLQSVEIKVKKTVVRNMSKTNDQGDFAHILWPVLSGGQFQCRNGQFGAQKYIADNCFFLIQYHTRVVTSFLAT